ncbi:MAG: T9SS type A sorting domain-containing protein [Chitinophagaceae bacterium]
MRKFSFLTTLLVLLLSQQNANAQSITIGGGTFVTATNTYGPFRSIASASQWNRNAYIYPTSLVNTIPSGSTVNSIEFFRDGTLAAVGTLTCKIYLKNTSATDFGAANLDWIAEAATATLVYSGDPTTIFGATTGFKQFPVSPAFIYTGNAVELLVEFSQTTAQSPVIQWAYDNAGGVPGYTINQGKYNNGTGTLPAATTTNASNERHPQLRINYTPFVFTNDMTVSAAVTPSNGATLTTGSSAAITVTVKNLGSAPQTAVPVYYRVDGGAPVGPVNTTGTMNTNDVQNVTLPNYVVTGGYHVIRAYTALAAEQNFPNDSLSINILGAPITSLPFFETFTPTIGWSANGSLWSIVTVTTQANGVGGQAAAANFYNVAAGVRDTLKSPVFSFSGASGPTLSYSFTHQAYTAAAPEPDMLQVIVSVDGGTTWSAPILSKSANGSPSLNTIPAAGPQYNPQARGDWRHELVNLATYAGQSNVKIGFVAVSANGNQLVLDNILVSNTTAYGSQLVVVPGVQPAINGVTINFAGAVPNCTEKVAKYVGVPPASQYNINTTATTQNGTIFTPNTISATAWYTVTYDSLTTYSISIDISGIANAPVPQELYIMKRSAQNDKWTALNTTLSGNTLTATGLTSFSDFAIGGNASVNPLPIGLISFSGTKQGAVNKLSWSTASESNNKGFELEHSVDGRNFSVVAFINSKALNGNSNTVVDYDLTDAVPFVSGTYYRLKQVDFNGNKNVSKVILLKGLNPTKIELNYVYPNPVSKALNLVITAPATEMAVIVVTDLNGKSIIRKTISLEAGNNNIRMDIGNLATGTYFLKTINKDGNDSEIKKIIKL